MLRTLPMGRVWYLVLYHNRFRFARGISKFIELFCFQDHFFGKNARARVKIHIFAPF